MLDEDPNTPPKSTPLYTMMRRELKRKKRSEEYIDNYVAEHVKLYFKIKKEGFNPRQRIQITLQIDEDGTIRVYDGHHRMSMIKYWGTPKEVSLPVIKCHPKWLKSKGI